MIFFCFAYKKNKRSKIKLRSIFSRNTSHRNCLFSREFLQLNFHTSRSVYPFFLSRVWILSSKPEICAFFIAKNLLSFSLKLGPATPTDLLCPVELGSTFLDCMGFSAGPRCWLQVGPAEDDLIGLAWYDFDIPDWLPSQTRCWFLMVADPNTWFRWMMWWDV